MATIKQTIAQILGVHPSLAARCTEGEFRVTFKDLSRERQEAVAYYTDDAQDALDTAKAMLRERRAKAIMN